MTHGRWGGICSSTGCSAVATGGKGDGRGEGDRGGTGSKLERRFRAGGPAFDVAVAVVGVEGLALKPD